MNRKLINKSNYVLRKVLNTEENIDILQDFIESVLDIKIEQIYLNPYLEEKYKYLPKEENFGVADLRIVTSNNEEFNIGIQFLDGIYYTQNKLLLYYSQIHGNQLEYGENRNIAPTRTINILDYRFFENDKYHKKIELAERSNEIIVVKELEIHTIELPKFNKNPDIGYNKKEAWVAYIKGIKFDINQEKFEKIKKLDILLEDYWKNEKME